MMHDVFSVNIDALRKILLNQFRRTCCDSSVLLPEL